MAARPALWRVDGAGTLWLFGAMHALPRDDWMSPALDRAVAGAGELVLEVAPGDDPATAFAARAMRLDLPPLAERVPLPLRPALAKVLEQLSLPSLDGEASWAAALAIGGAATARAGARREHGVDAVLARAFQRAGKPVRALETAAAQLAMFAALPEEQQRLMLARSVTDALAPDRYEALVAAWRGGDLVTVETRLAAGTEGAPGLHEALVIARNRRFAAWAAARVRRPGTVLMAVGVGHLVGVEGVPALLRTLGAKVARLA